MGDWKDNRKDGYGIKVYDNKDKYEVNYILVILRVIGKMTCEMVRVPIGPVSGRINIENFIRGIGIKTKKKVKGFSSTKMVAVMTGK